jgi:transposase
MDREDEQQQQQEQQEQRPKPCGPSSDPPHRGGRPRVTPEQQQEIVRLRKVAGYGMRRIAERVGCDRKIVRKVLAAAGLETAAPTPPQSPTAGKLDGFKALIEELAKKGLKVPRILREIRERGYTGSRTIVADYARQFRAPRAPKKVRRRFATRPGEEMQVDWSPYRVQIAGRLCTVHAFAAVLHYSRKMHVRFYADERQSTLLEAHVHAFEDLGGVTQRVVYDRMATIVLGKVAQTGDPIWHPRFLEFAAHYGYQPYLCRVRDPDRKGGVESSFGFLEHDFVIASSFASLDEMNARARTWLDEVANVRVHGTTRKVPDEEWLLERDLLIALPDAHFPVFEETHREVAEDTTVWVRGTPYTVPWRLANHTVTMRLYHGHFEVLGPDGTVAMRRAYVGAADKGRLQIDPAHHEGMPRRRDPRGPGAARRLEESLILRFPSLAELVAGITRRMKGLAHIHVRILSRLAARHGDEAFLRAGERALQLRACNAHTVKRLLERDAPPPAEPVPPLTRSRSLGEFTDDVDPGSLDDYAELDELDEQEGADGT